MKLASCIALAIAIAIAHISIGTVNGICTEDEFECHNGDCIHEDKKCNGLNDCLNGEDEENDFCNFLIFNRTGELPRLRIESNQTQTDKLENNVDLDSNRGCLSGFISCKNGRCIEASWECDGEDDCGDNSDESNCTNKICRNKQFQCADEKCIPEDWVCDGTADCMDGSDELNCTRKCESTQFLCNDKKTCIPRHWLCDGESDCPDGSDEDTSICRNGTTTTAKASVENPVLRCEISNGGCDHLCFETSSGVQCDCRQGYELRNTTKCIDIDECKIFGTCSQLCTNKMGSYECDCANGYEPDPTNHNRCIAKSGHDSLLFGLQNSIFNLSLENLKMLSNVKNVSYTQSLTLFDYSQRLHEIFWCDVDLRGVYRTKIDDQNGYNRKIIREIPDGVTINGLAIDWIFNRIYYTQCSGTSVDPKNCSIIVSDFDGKMEITMIADEIGTPHAIAVDPMHSMIYWTDCGRSPHIERAGTDGTQRQILIEKDIVRPVGLTLDFTLDRIYWCDSELNKISSCKFDGSDCRQILQSQKLLSHPFSLATFEDFIYWTEQDKGIVMKANKFNGSDLGTIAEFRKPMTIHVYHSNRQPVDNDYCTLFVMNCSHLCLPSPRKAPVIVNISCACPLDMKLLPDRKTCSAIETRINTSVGEKTPGIESVPLFTFYIIPSVILAMILIVAFVIRCCTKHNTNNVESA